MKYLLFAILLTSCAKFKNIKTYQDGESYFKYSDIENPRYDVRAIRDKKNDLVFEKEEAEKVLAEIGTLEELKKRTPQLCSNKFSFSKDYFEIINFLKKEAPDKAIGHIQKLIDLCPTIKKNSHVHYLSAFSYHLKKDQVKRDEFLNLFLNQSESIFPRNHFQENNPQEKVSLYLKYRKHVKDVLAGSEFKLDLTSDEHLKIPRYKSVKNSFLPGTKTETGRSFLIIPGYSTAVGGTIEALYNIDTQYGEFIPYMSFDEVFGSLSTLIYRKQLTQSLNRKHQTGINLNLHQWKRLKYKIDIFDRISDVKTVESGIGNRVGYGGTYQFTNDFNFIYQGSYFSNYKNGFNGTALLGYAVAEGAQFQFGLLNDQSVIAYKLNTIYMMWSTSSEEFNFSLGGALQF
jgi:hypothetical protein